MRIKGKKGSHLILKEATLLEGPLPAGPADEGENEEKLKPDDWGVFGGKKMLKDWEWDRTLNRR